MYSSLINKDMIIKDTKKKRSEERFEILIEAMDQ